MKSYFARSIGLFAASVSMLCLGAPALAQNSKPASEAEDAADAPEIIVTGVVNRTRKIDTTNTINTISGAAIQQLAPISTADLLSNIPGFYAEGSTAGEASNNITVRGLPVTGGFRYAPQLFDGLPWYEEPEVQFMNNDVAVRPDLMTESIQVVKGGTGAILYSNGLGAVVNHITRTGGQEFAGGYKLELANYGFVRNDGYLSGPINENLTFAIGGFYRISRGIRKAGYTADNGGQLRGNLKYTSDDGSTEVFVQAHFINDRTEFSQNLPFSVPRVAGPGTAANPIVIDPSTVQPLGLNFGNGTFASPFDRIITQIGEYGTREVDLADGIHPNFQIYTFKFSKKLDSGWMFKAGARYTTGTNDFNANFTGNDTALASSFNNARLQNDVINPAYGAANGCDLNGRSPGSAKLLGFFNVTAATPCASLQGLTRDAFIANFSRFGAGGVGAFTIDNGQRVADSRYLNFLLPFITNVKASSFSGDFEVQKTVELVGTHNFTVGGYVTNYTNKQNFQASLTVATAEVPSRLVDLYVIDGAGNKVGPSITSNGAILPGFFGYTSDSTNRGYAAYVLDHWETPGGRLKVDAGLRWQQLDATLVRRDRNNVQNLTPANVVVGSPQDTTADNEIFLPGPPRTFNGSFNAIGWSVGANYSFKPSLAVYGLVARSFRMPSLEDLNEFRIDTNSNFAGGQVPRTQVERIFQLEGGVRYQVPRFSVSAAIFYNNFAPRNQVNVYRNTASSSCSLNGTVPDINRCPEVAEVFKRGVRNIGTEVEFAFRPRFVDGLELVGSFTYQDPKIKGSNFTVTREVRNSAGVITGYNLVKVGEDGRRPRRLSNFMVNFRPTFDFKPMTNLPVKIYGQYSYNGSRYSESRDIDVTLYPAYSVLNIGTIVDFTDKLALQLHIANVTNSLSFTEGDPVFSDLLSPDGTRNRGVARPLFGRTYRASVTYRF